MSSPHQGKVKHCQIQIFTHGENLSKNTRYFNSQPKCSHSPIHWQSDILISELGRNHSTYLVCSTHFTVKLQKLEKKNNNQVPSSSIMTLDISQPRYLHKLNTETKQVKKVKYEWTHQIYGSISKTKQEIVVRFPLISLNCTFVDTTETFYLLTSYPRTVR